MSVINKMLNDLESRQGQALANSDYQPPTKKSGKLIGLLFVCILASAALGYYVSTFHQGIELNDVIVAEVPKVGESENSPSSENAASVRKVMDDAPVSNVASLDGEKLTTSIGDDVGGNAVPAAQVVQSLIKAAADKKLTESQNLKGLQLAGDTAKGGLDDVSGRTSEHASEPLIERAADMTDKFGAQTVVPERTMSVKVSKITPEQTISSLKAEALAALNHGQTDEAINLLEALLKAEPTNLKARKQLASLYFGENQIESAIDLLHRGMAAAPNDSELNLLLARIYQSISQAEKALSTLKKVTVSPSTSDELFELRAALAQQAGDDQLAMDDYQHLVLKNPNDARWWLGQGIVADKIGNEAVATVSYQEVIRLSQLSLEVEQFVNQRLLVLGGAQ